MDISFAEEKDKCVVIYLDDITVFSKSREDHLKHMERVLEKCRRFGISLNPKKSNFVVDEGKLLRHIVSKDGINIDPNRVSAILKIDIPRKRKEVESFIGKANFLRIFLQNFAENCKRITCMPRKDNCIKWTVESKQSFSDIKKALIEAPVPVSPDFTKDF